MAFNPFDEASMMNMLSRRQQHTARRFDEYYRCYPIVMAPGAERPHLNYGGKIILPPSALDKLTRLHITYPMLFELKNTPMGTMTHGGIIEFIAEEGKCYLPHWMMQTLSLSIGDLLQVLSTALPLATFVKLQAQSVSFLDISDPKAVLENAFRNFSTLTKGDVFSFEYNDSTYAMEVLETKPVTEKGGVCMIECDVEVDFDAPVGYVEPEKVYRTSGQSTPGSNVTAGGVPLGGLTKGGMLHTQGTMAQSINFDAIKPSATTAAQGARAVNSNFATGGHTLKGKKGPTPSPSTPVAGASSNRPAVTVSRTNGPQPLRLGPNKLFFGYEVKPVKTDEERERERERADADQPRFEGQGQSLRGGKGKGKAEESAPTEEKTPKASDTGGRRLDGRKA